MEPAAHWFLGLPVAYFLAFHSGFGVIGLWWGLSIGLIICGVALPSSGGGASGYCLFEVTSEVRSHKLKVKRPGLVGS